MENKKKLTDLKVGDAVWTLQDGHTEVVELCPKNQYPIRTCKGFYQKSYTIDGKINSSQQFQSLFLDNPFEDKIEPKEMMCEWQGTYKKVECIVSSDGRVFVQSGYKNAKEIEPEETLPLAISEISLEQIAEKFGVDVMQIRIKP